MTAFPPGTVITARCETTYRFEQWVIKLTLAPLEVLVCKSPVQWDDWH